MKKKLRSLFIVASLSLAASLAILACGDGVPDLLEDFMQGVYTSEGPLNDKIGEIVDSSEPPPISSEQPTSSAEPTPGSSAAPNPVSSAAPNPGSSAAPNPGSSASGTSSTTTPSSSSVPKSSAAPPVTAKGCKESSPKSGFTCGWSISGNSTTPGKELTHAAASPPAGCSAIDWKYVDNDDDMTLEFGCTALTAPIMTEGSKKYLLFAELTCDDGKHTNACNKTPLSTLRAPGLTGTCTWKRSNGDVVTETTQARGAVPGGVTLVDNDHVCGTTLPSVVYKYDGGSKTWPKDGGPVPEAKTFTDVQATVTCPAYDVVPMTCPALKVNGGADYQISCNGDKCTEAKGVKADECIDVEIDWKDAGYFPALKIACQVDRGGSNSGTISIKVGSKSPVSGNDYLAVEIVKITKVGLVEVSNICLSFPGGTDKTAGNCKISQ